MKHAYVLGALGILFFLGIGAEAKVVSISTSTPTNLLPTTFFGTKTVTLYAGTTNQVYLNSESIASTQTFVNSSYSITSSSGILILPGWHGNIYGLAPNAQGAVNIFTMDGQ